MAVGPISRSLKKEVITSLSLGLGKARASASADSGALLVGAALGDWPRKVGTGEAAAGEAAAGKADARKLGTGEAAARPHGAAGNAAAESPFGGGTGDIATATNLAAGD